MRNLVPCRKSNGAVCMYDTVGKTYYENANTTSDRVEFTAGPAV